MAKKLKNIILTRRRKRIEFKDVDGWIFDLKYLVNSKEIYNCQVLKTDIPGRVTRLQKEGFEILNND